MKTTSRAGLLIAIGWAASCASSAQPAQPAVVHEPEVAWIDQTLIAPSAFTSEGLAGQVRVYTRDKRLGIQWSYDDSGTRSFHVEQFELSYWPTAAARFNDARLTNGTSFLVAGVSPTSGKTIIERWDIALSAIPGDSSSTAVTKTVLFDSDVAGKRTVRTMTPVHGLQNAVFGQFGDSHDLYRIDALSGQQTLVLTPQQESFLGFDTYLFWSGGRLASGAYCYVYRCDPTQDDDGSLLLYDDDGNGTIDSTTPLRKGEFSTIEPTLQWVARFNT